MMIVDLVDAVRQCEPLDRRNIDRLISQGAAPIALFRDADGRASPILRSRIVQTAPSRFEFEAFMHGEDGQPALVIVEHDRFGEVNDLVGWRGEFLGTWLGRAALLGECQLHGFRLAEHVEVHEGPLQWLAAARRGVVVIDETRAGERLRPVPLLAASVPHGRRIRRLCTPPAPRISVAMPSGSSRKLCDLSKEAA